MGGNGSCPAVEEAPQCLLDSFVIQLPLLGQEQAGLGLDPGPRQAAASVLSASHIAAEETGSC